MTDDHVVEIQHLLVAPDMRGRGVGGIPPESRTVSGRGAALAARVAAAR